MQLSLRLKYNLRTVGYGISILVLLYIHIYIYIYIYIYTHLYILFIQVGWVHCPHLEHLELNHQIHKKVLLSSVITIYYC